MNPANIEVHIKELLLDGFAPGDRYRIAGAVEGELVRLFAEQDVSLSMSEGAEVEWMPRGTIYIARGSKAEAIGNQIAQNVHTGINR